MSVISSGMQMIFRLLKMWWVLAILGLLASYFAVRTVSVVVRNPSPTEMTCAQYIEEQPSAEWLRLQDCYPLMDEIVYMTGKYSNSVSDVYVPYGPAGGGKIAVVVQTNDELWIALAEMEESPSERELNFAAQPTTIEGMLDYQSSEDDELEEIRELIGRNEVPLLKQGESPSWWLAMYQFGLVLACGIGALFGFRKSRKANAGTS